MTTSQAPSEAPGALSPRILIKRTARLLIAERGVRDVSVREIAQAANQRNLGVVAYYFGTKDKLIAEILTDGAERIEALRNAHLDQLEAKGGPETIEEAIAAIIIPSATFSDEDLVYGRAFNRFLLQLSLNNSGFIDETLAGRWNLGYQRCLAHLRRLTPELGKAEQSRRFLFMGTYVGAVLASREAAIADADREHRMWRSKETLDDIVRTTAAMMAAPLAR
jgi:AcrR family transcriptional regulator